MKKMAVLGLLLGTIMTSSAFAGANTLATGIASVKTTSAEVNDELIKKLTSESHLIAFDNCIRSNEYDMCEMTTAQTTCKQSIGSALDTIITLTCTTDLEF